MNNIIESIWSQLEKNDIIAGGAVLGALAYLLSYLRSVPFVLAKWSRFLFVTHIDIPDRTNSFAWISAWLSNHSYIKASKRITVEVKDGKTIVTPAPGKHLIWWNRRPIIFNRIRREGTGSEAARAFRELWSITIIGKRNLINDFITECKDVYEQDKKDFIKVTEADQGYWGNISNRRKRDLTTVFLAPGLKELITKDIDDFVQSKDWYYKMGIPWRRGYLLTGPPGNGKSSLITAIASLLNFQIYVINLANIVDHELTSLLGDIPENSIVLLEDIDCTFVERDNKKSVSLSTLLNLLDGVNSSEGRIVFMTSNRPEKLDKALIRPGRIDLIISLDNAQENQIIELYNKFFPGYDSSEFLDLLKDHSLSMSSIQGYLLRFRHSQTSVKKNIKELLDA